MATTQAPSPPENLRKPNDQHVPWLLRRIWDRVNTQNEHFMGVIVGQEGSGKSYTAIKIAHEIDPSFNADRVIFDVQELLTVLAEGEHEPGNFYVLDEAGVQLGVRTWQERGQVLANQALQLIRNHNLGLLFTLPRLGELDSQAEGRLQAFLELTEKDEGEYVAGKWKWMDPDRANQTGKIYKKFPRRIVNGRKLRIRKVAFRPPDPDIIKPYEEKKTGFQEQFYERTISELDDEVSDEDVEEMTAKEIATEVASNGLGDYVSMHGQTGEPYINRDLIRVSYETSESDARAIKSLLEKQFSKEELENHV